MKSLRPAVRDDERARIDGVYQSAVHGDATTTGMRHFGLIPATEKTTLTLRQEKTKTKIRETVLNGAGGCYCAGPASYSPLPESPAPSYRQSGNTTVIFGPAQ